MKYLALWLAFIVGGLLAAWLLLHAILEPLAAIEKLTHSL